MEKRNSQHEHGDNLPYPLRVALELWLSMYFDAFFKCTLVFLYLKK